MAASSLSLLLPNNPTQSFSPFTQNVIRFFARFFMALQKILRRGLGYSGNLLKNRKKVKNRYFNPQGVTRNKTVTLTHCTMILSILSYLGLCQISVMETFCENS